MSKTKAVHWPVLLANSLTASKSGCQPVARATFSSLPHGCNGTSPSGKGSGAARKRTSAKSQLPPCRQPSRHMSSLSQPASSTRSAKTKSALHASGNDTRSIRDTASCLCSCGYYSPLLPTTASPRIVFSAPGRQVSRQTRQTHTHGTLNAVSADENTSLHTPIQHDFHDRRARTAQKQSSNDDLSTYDTPRGAKILPRRRKQAQWQDPSLISPATLPSATIGHDKSALALSNLRLLIHPEHHIIQNLQPNSSFRTELLANHRIPSSIIPPLSALLYLFQVLDSSKRLDQLSSADWNSFVFWLSHYKDYQTMSYVHRVITGKQILASKCSTLSYTVLTEARLRQIRNEQLSRTISTRSDPEPMPSLSKVVQSTVKRMEGAGARQSHEMYGLWLKSAVEERNWVQGIGAWKGLKANKGQLVEYPISMTIHAIQCYLHAGLIKDATKLCETILERSTTALQKKEYALLMDGGSLPRTDGKLETKVSDRRLEFMRRQRQALKELANMQLMTSMAGSAPESTNSEQILAWKSAAYPALIEALSLEDTDKHGASLASELAMELHNQGHVLDATRFRFLVRYIGASTSSEIAESFVKRWIGLSTTSPSQSTLSLSTKEDLAGNTSSTNLARDSGKATRAAIVPTRNLIDAGLLEVVRQSIEERNFDRACRIFQGLSLQGTPIDADTAEKLIVGLTEDHDFPSATAVLEKSLQDNGAPSVETANILLQGLIHADRLDESVTMFRNLTENHGLKPSVQMYRSLMRLTASYGQLAMAQRILSVLKGLGVKQDWELYRDLMQCYVRSENLQGAIKVFENMDRARIKNRIDHINVLLEGAVRQSSPPTVIGILEIMSSQRITPDPETWNILLSGAFQNKDRVLAQELFQELARSVTPNVSIRTDRNLRASRHPVTFQLLVNEFAERHGVESALKLLKGALDAEYPRGHVAPSLYRDLIEKSCRQHKGVAGFAFYRLLRQSERAYNRPSRISSSVTKDKATLLSPVASLPSPSPTSSFTPSPSLTSTSRSVLPPSPANLCLQLMIQLDEEGEYAHGKDLATDWIISGSEMDQEMVRHAIRFYAKSGEFSTAFGLFTKMGRAYGVEPSREMVMDLVEAIRTHDIGMTMPVEDGASVTPSTQASKDVLDASETQQWLKVLRGAMARFGVSEATA